MTLLIRPIQEKENDAVYQMFQDIPAEENGAKNHAHGLTYSEFDDFCKSSVSAARMEGLAEGSIPQILYIMIDGDIPVGFGKFRPFLDDFCKQNRVGHFAYMISPKFRGKGYATKFLSLIKEEAQKLGLKEIEGATLKNNQPSCHVIIKI